MIKKLKQNCTMPVVGNGDITSPEIAKKVLDYTGCDYVMIGRGAMGNPFIFEQINDYLEYGTYKQYSLTNRLEAFVTYLELTSKYNIRFANIKQQAIRFTKGTVGGAQLRNRLSTTKNINELKELLLQKVTA
jgi:tRNA-dihydrouridine synthase